MNNLYQQLMGNQSNPMKQMLSAIRSSKNPQQLFINMAQQTRLQLHQQMLQEQLSINMNSEKHHHGHMRQ